MNANVEFKDGLQKVFVNTAVNSGKKYNEKDIIQVTLLDGRTGSCFDSKITEHIGKEVELDVKKGKEYNGVQQYYFNFPKVGGGAGKGFAPKDYSFDKRRVALEQTVALIISGKIEMKSLAECRDKFFEYLNSK